MLSRPELKEACLREGGEKEAFLRAVGEHPLILLLPMNPGLRVQSAPDHKHTLGRRWDPTATMGLFLQLGSQRPRERTEENVSRD